MGVSRAAAGRWQLARRQKAEGIYLLASKQVSVYNMHAKVWKKLRKI